MVHIPTPLCTGNLLQRPATSSRQLKEAHIFTPPRTEALRQRPTSASTSRRLKEAHIFTPPRTEVLLQRPASSTSRRLGKTPIFTKKKIKAFLAAGNDIAIPILTVVKNTTGIFPPIRLAADVALFIANNVKVRGCIQGANRPFC